LASLGREALCLVSPATPYVCIGFHQDAQQEVDLEFCKANSIPVFRREVGGGAVYLDGWQLFYQLVIHKDNPLAPSDKGEFYRKFLAPVVQAYSTIRPEYCQACGLCVPECPGKAISMVSYDPLDHRRAMPTIIGKVDKSRKEPVVAAFICTHHVGVHGFSVPENVKAIPVHCTSRVDILDMLKAIECGADGVAVVRCGEGTCKYQGISKRVTQRVNRVKELLGMLGMEKERVELLTAVSSNGNPYAKVCGDFSGRIKELGLR